MPIRNLHWTNRNDGIKYPVDDQATALDDAGALLPSEILADLFLRWPKHLGDYAFLSSVSVTRSLVTVTIQAARTLDDEDFTPLAVLSVTKPVQDGRVYALQPQVQGVGGWVVFGRGVQFDPTDGLVYRGRFSSPRQSRLAPRAARPYRGLPVHSAQVQNAATRLTGVVLLRGVLPVRVVKEERTIDGVLRDCIVIRLVDVAGVDGFAVPAAAREISGFKEASSFQEFAGPCANRPESGTCGTPEPIEFVNAVAPDCNGVLTLEFRGCAAVAQVLGTCGIIVDCDLGLARACLPPYIPSSDGKLPSEYDPIVVEPPIDPPPPDPEPGASESLVVLGELPYIDCFHDGVADDFVNKYGLWQLVEDDSPATMCDDESVPVSESLSASTSASVGSERILQSLEAYTTASRNITVWEGFDDSTVYRRIMTDVKLALGPAGSKTNAGIVLNYRQASPSSTAYLYHLVEIDYETQEFRIVRFNGTNTVPVVPVSVPGIHPDAWYRIDVNVVPGATPGQITITAQLTSISEPGLIDVTLSVTVNDYGTTQGRFGFHTNRALARFSYFYLREFP